MKVFRRSTIFAIVFSVLFIVTLKVPCDYYTYKSNVTKKIQTSLEKYIQVACNKTVEVSKLSYPSRYFMLDTVKWRAE
ncbi:hypothetical protein [Paenibacillus solani]|uniref:Uncharacterized protein n=1 Tax=Paenibacillus solani TaxID=1705565 RepID=A0A0M1P051_9BACL|nr:hypothetical protein [Paenibacillus solani]KOR87777.1 hypothetical protein AM231_00540 [Paenibacillus solani]